MPPILRLCLYAVSANGSKAQLWLSFPILRTTTPRDIILLARRSVEERMAAELEMHASYETQLAFCMCSVRGRFVFLGTASMTEAHTPILGMPFFEELLRVQQETREVASKAPWEGFIFTQGILVPVPDLLRLNHRAPRGRATSFAFCETVVVPLELGSDPVVDDIVPSVAMRATDTELPPHDFEFPVSSTFASSSVVPTAVENTSLFTPARTQADSATSMLVKYVNFAGRTYMTRVRLTETPSLQSVMSEACAAFSAQVGCVFQPCNMQLMCSRDHGTPHSVDDDNALRDSLTGEGVHFYLAVDGRLLASSSPHRLEVPEGRPVLMLKETQNDLLETVADANKPDSPWALATSAATLRQLGGLHPTPIFSPQDRLSVLRTRPTPLLGPSTSATVANMRHEEDTARLRLASAHFSLDEARRKHKAAVLVSDHDATYEGLRKKKAVLTEEWTECVSAERDCQRLETLVAWLEKDKADGYARQEKLIRALYAA
ncbi:hypothetical protein TraAM80_08514 [Trypanosoma rangeli]|uniref:Uncharacterized protein n=1 Tax=Trypanosoma rangeli TaxID=5698 RepID=A0A422N0A3_TRYRA|nr:uncharacterized protein TraAM80_08514 [Trypanosoma rangeli]RNE98895.1 hypothetical protein TraAM80_08514 [Trypanosoma rangeli]|eukprot:RNE98895.1 hypothetical protein TraAM80_08514 [Trypanosoma rangeli]